MDIDYAPAELKTSPPRTPLRMAAGACRWTATHVVAPVIVWTPRLVCYVAGAMLFALARLVLHLARLRWHHVRAATRSVKLHYWRTRNRILGLNPWRERVPMATLAHV